MVRMIARRGSDTLLHAGSMSIDGYEGLMLADRIGARFDFVLAMLSYRNPHV